jgi:hypothetical protein
LGRRGRGGGGSGGSRVAGGGRGRTGDDNGGSEAIDNAAITVDGLAMVVGDGVSRGVVGGHFLEVNLLSDGGSTLLEVLVDEATRVDVLHGFGFRSALDDGESVSDGARGDRGDGVGEGLLSGESSGPSGVVQGTGSKLGGNPDGCAQHSDSVESQGSEEESG